MANDRLILFDCDGVLVDSEPLAIAVLMEVVREAGVSLDEETAYRRFLGCSIRTTSAILLRDFGLRFDAAHVRAMRARLFERFRRDLLPVPGVAEMLERLGRPRCVASSSQLRRIRLALEVTGLRAAFEPHIFSASMVRHGKPAPDLFLHAAAVMGFPAERCVVIEDSPAGIEAARRAGMAVFAFLGGNHAAAAGLQPIVAALGPDRVFDDMSRLPDLLDAFVSEGPTP